MKLVDAEDIANDKIRTHDPTLEVNSITNKLQSQNLETQKSEHLMFTQPRDPNNKHKPAYKKYCSYCHRTNHSITACFRKQRDVEDRSDAYARFKSPQKSFVQYFRPYSRKNNSYRINNKPTESYDRHRRISTSRHSNTNRNTSSQNRYRPHSRDRYRYHRTTTPPLLNKSRYDNCRRNSRFHRLPNRSSYRSPYRRYSRPRYRSRSYSRDRPFPHYTSA